jgi:hypothetical protein
MSANRLLFMALALAVSLCCLHAEVTSIKVAPEHVLTDLTSERSLVLAEAYDATGAPVPFAPLTFSVGDPLQADFIAPVVYTDDGGKAANVLVRFLAVPRLVDTHFTVSADLATAGPFPITGWNMNVDGSPYGFTAPPLAPFVTPRQRVAGTVGLFIVELPVGTTIDLWSTDPTLVEPSQGIITGPPDQWNRQPLEFDLLAHRPGEAIIVLRTLDTAVYEATVDGFLRGDCDTNRVVNVSDAIYLLMYLFAGTSAPQIDEACNINDRGDLDIGDAIYLLLFLMASGPPPPAPFPEPGFDTTD